MLNWKTIIGAIILLLAAQQSLVANEYYRTGRLSSSPVSVISIFVIFVGFGIFLIIKGIKRDQTY